MKSQVVLFIVLIGICGSLTAWAADTEAPRRAPGSPTGIDVPHKLNNSGYFQGFEGEGFPPPGWTRSSASGHEFPENFGPAGTAHGPVIEGNRMMTCWWDPDLVPQDNKIEFDYPITAGEDHLNFFIAGTYLYIDNYDCTLEINGVEVYSWQEAYSVPENWQYEFVNIDLTEHTGTTVNIAFRYIGVDGAAIYIDALMVDDGTGYVAPEPPANDTCEGAWANQFFIDSGSFTHHSDNADAAHDYLIESQGCTGWSDIMGKDLVWVVCLERFDRLDIEMVTDPYFSASMALVTDCTDPAGSCVAGDDGNASFSYTAMTEGVYYLICSAIYATELGGPFHITGNLYGDGCVPFLSDSPEPGLLKSQLGPAYPNPFNPGTEISYTLAGSQDVDLAIFDLNGRRVSTLFSGQQDSGTHRVAWNGRDQNGRSVSSGIYFARLLTGQGEADMQKLTLLK